jgi:chemotaxis protein MotB
MIKRRKRTEEEHENVERWMVSYADFVTLLFCFFTAMYAISNVDNDKLGKFVRSMRDAFNASPSSTKAFSVIEDIPLLPPLDMETEAKVKEEMASLVSEAKGGIEIKRDERGVTISMMDKFLFESGSAQLKESSRVVVDAAAAAMKNFPNMIRIEGHTDNVHISNMDFRSNWQLSSMRAINVAEYFIRVHGISPERVSATGYAEYKPIAPNDTPEGRSRNRRVDIVILSEKEGKKEPR